MARGPVMPTHGGLAWRLILAFTLTLALLGGLAPAPAAAATIVVRSGADGGGSCPGASCTLRQALAVAANGDTITFAPALSLVTLTTAELAVTRSVTIQGRGNGEVAVRRSAAGGIPRFRIFHVTGGSSVTLRGLTVANGDVEGMGGGILIEGGALALEASVVAGNTARPAPNSSNSNGGGIAALSALVTLTNSTVSGNAAHVESAANFANGNAYGGGIYAFAIAGAAAVTLTGSAVSGNVARVEGTATGTDTTISGYAYGGGIHATTTDGPVSVTLTRSTLNDNTAHIRGAANYVSGNVYGGGIYANAGGFPGAANVTVAFTGSTLSGNTARVEGTATGPGTIVNSYAYGGGLYAFANSFQAAANVTVTLSGSTLSDNIARVKGTATGSGTTVNGYANGGGLYAFTGNGATSVSLTDSAVNDNSVDMEGMSNSVSGYAYGGGLYASTGSFQAATSTTVTLSGSTLSDNIARVKGTAAGTGTIVNGNAYGGGIYAITSSGATSVTLTDSTLSDNTAHVEGAADYTSGYAEGGGLYAFAGGGAASVILTGSAASGNVARVKGTDDTGAYISGNAYGGGIYAFASNGAASVTLNGSVASGNTAHIEGVADYVSGYAYGGGLYAFANDGHTSVTMTSSAANDNVARVEGAGNNTSSYIYGGGLYAFANSFQAAASTTVTLSGSTLSGNTARTRGTATNSGNLSVYGGGLYAFAGGGTAPIALTNSTLSGNTALVEWTANFLSDYAYGGGIYASASDGSAPMTLDHATLADNTASDSTPTGNGHQIYTSGLPVTAARSVFALPAGGPAGDFFALHNATLTSGGDNVSQRDLPNATGTDLIGTDPLLGPLADNGGPTRTHLPTATSPLVDRIPTNRCAASTDQRGIPRPSGPGCDTGAVELGRYPTALDQVRGTATYGDTATLTARLTLAANGEPLAGRTIAFTLNGQPVGTATTDDQGIATLTGVSLGALGAGNYTNRACATYAGNDLYAPAGPTCGALVVARQVLWVKPIDRTVGLKQPNPPTTPPAGCVQQQTPTSACWLQLANGSTFVNGDDWGDLNLAQVRFAYSRTGSGPANEQVGATYRITALGALSANYDIRYQTGTLRVVAP